MDRHLKAVSLLPGKYPTEDDYPFNLPILNQTEQFVFDSAVTIFVGENGSGKSTLLEALARKADIHIWCKSNGTRYKVNRYEKLLYKYLLLEWSNGKVPGAFFGSEIFHDFRSILDDWAASDPGQLKYFGGRSLMTQSHGQSMMSYFRSRYRIKGLYLLDEPETALSPRSQLELLDIIIKNSQAGHAQFIISTHSPILMACEEAKIYSFDHVPARIISYKETEHYKLYRKLLVEQSTGN